jgi:hypothetical protein
MDKKELEMKMTQNVTFKKQERMREVLLPMNATCGNQDILASFATQNFLYSKEGE